MSQLIGKTIDRYEVRELLGRGAMAEVYRAHDPRLGRDVAIKLILPALADEDNFARRFETEAKAVAAMTHPHIVQVFDFGVSEHGPYMVMEFVADNTLKDRLKNQVDGLGRLPLSEATRITEAIGSALDYAHRKGVIHRDVKPTNILFRADGTPVLTDFGIARVLDTTQFTATSSLTGTPAYMAPEQANGQPVPQSDLYSLGVVLFQMMTGRTPFTASSTTEMVLKHVQAEPPSPLSLRADLPAGLVPVMARALAKRPEDRFQTGADLTAALKQAQSSATVVSTPATPSASPSPTTPTTPPPALKMRTTTIAEVLGALVGRKVEQPGQEGALGQIVAIMGLLGVLLTALQFILSSITTLSDAMRLLGRYAGYVAIGSLAIAAVVAVRIAMVSAQHRRRALTGLGALVVVGGAWAGWSLYQNNLPPKGPIVLIAQFNCNGCADRRIFDADIYNELLKQSEAMKFPIDVRRVSESDQGIIDNTLTARQLGLASKATLVIWGNYDSATVSPQFELIGAPEGMSPLLGTDDLRSFSYNLTANTRKLEHVAFLALGLMQYVQGRYDTALSLLDRAVSSLPADKGEVSAEAAYFYRANTRLRTGRPIADVVSDLVTARDYDPKTPQIRHNLSIAYVNACKPDGSPALDLALIENNYVIESGTGDASAYEVRGWILGLLHEWDEAADAYETALQMGSTHIETQRGLILAYQMLGRPDDARQATELPQFAVAVTATNTLSDAIATGDVHWYAGQFSEAALSYQQAISEAQHMGRPSDEIAGLYVFAGLAYGKAAQWQSAADAFEQSLQVAPRYFGLRNKSSASPYTLLGMAYRELGLYDKAQENLRRALKIQPCAEDTLQALANVLVKQKQYGEAMQVLTQAEIADPTNGAIDFVRAIALEETHQPTADVRAAYQAATRKYEALLAHQPGDAASREVLNQLNALLLKESGTVLALLEQATNELAKLDYTAAISPARQAIALSPENARAHLLLGSALRHINRQAEGLVELQTAQKLGPNDPLIYRELGITYSQLKQFGDAAAAYHRAIELNPDDGFSWQQLANVLWSAGKPGDAIEPAQRAAELLPDNELTHGTLGMVLVESRRYTDAVPALTHAIEISPSYSFAIGSLADAYYHLDKLDEALLEYRRFNELNPQDPYSQIAIAFILAEQGKAEAAFEAAQHALELQPDPNNPLLQFALGVGYRAQGKSAEANAAFKVVMDSDAADAELKDKARRLLS